LHLQLDGRILVQLDVGIGRGVLGDVKREGFEPVLFELGDHGFTEGSVASNDERCHGH